MARDLIHQAIKSALEKDGWVITDDPLTVINEQTKFFIDIGARKFITATKGQKEIAIEIKTFGYTSILEPFYSALGKYLVYRTALEDSLNNRTLFLGISRTTFFRI
ncbi:MAG: element excision factor XisH family protein, partial [Bacteroidota bacterium]